MQIKRCLGLAILVSAACLFASHRASAQNTDVTFNNANGSIDCTLTFPTDGGLKSSKVSGVELGNYNITVNGQQEFGFCTDLWNNIYDGESWKAESSTVYGGTYGINTITAGSTGIYSGIASSAGKSEANEIDYVAASYSADTEIESGASQLAIWDLECTGGTLGVAYNSITGKYSWSASNDFNATSFALVASPYTTVNAQTVLMKVYNIETAAISDGQANASGSTFLNAGPANGWDVSPSGDGRPQDFIYLAAPEPAQLAIFLMIGLGIAGLMLRSRKAQARLSIA